MRVIGRFLLVKLFRLFVIGGVIVMSVILMRLMFGWMLLLIWK